MKATVIITSYNYEKFVTECVNSVALQTYPKIEIIFVDDGSSDNTLNLINELSVDNLTVVEKQNGGQLSAFNAAIPYINGDFVFFIDADDLFELDYIEKTIDFYKKNNDADFVFSAINYFGDKVVETSLNNTQSYGFTLCKTFFLRHWVGAPTSAISMRKNILEQILPLELELDWKVRADDCLVWGASLVGAKKYFFADAAIQYRVHGQNNFFGKQFNDDYFFKRSLGVNRLFNLITQKNYITITPDLLVVELLSNPELNIKVLFDYLKMALMLDITFLSTVRCVFRVIKHYFNRKLLIFR